ncbi:ABC transporter ATP-binding protein [Parasalinivibrio latis]|uniref:ABC transporter ATP-binding protein n=1 Tax=Parasalinivibrio latis TaxID=2952610 RepID=UPI0030E5D833
MAELKVAGVSKSYGSLQVLHDVDLEISSGEFVVFVGPSGCGKSTLLRSICGLEDISSGSIHMDGNRIDDIEPSARNIAMVFQSYALYPHMTVAENMGYSLKLKRLPKDEIRAKVEEVGQMLELTPYLDRLPRALSGGQRQRVAIGRAILRNPRVFLFDEPLSNLDAALRVHMRMELVKLKKDLPDTTMIYVTHDQHEAMTMADRIVVLRDGVIEQVGAPKELYDRPDNLFVAQFIGSPKMNLVTGLDAARYGAKTVGVRPEHMVISADGCWEGTVTHCEFLGADTHVYVSNNSDEPWVIREEGHVNHLIGDVVRIKPKDNLYYCFDLDGKRIPN